MVTHPCDASKWRNGAIRNVLLTRRWPWVVLLLGVVSVWLWADCLGRNRWDIEPGPAPGAFRQLPGLIGVHLGGRRLLFRNGDVKLGRISDLPRADPASVTGNDSRLPYWLPPVVGGQRVSKDSPRLPSPDGTLFAVGVGSSSSPGTLYIAEPRTGKVRSRIDIDTRRGMRAIAWSSDGRFVALLTFRAELGKCFTERIMQRIGFATRLESFSLEIFDVDGEAIASTDLGTRMTATAGQVVWIQ